MFTKMEKYEFLKQNDSHSQKSSYSKSLIHSFTSGNAIIKGFVHPKMKISPCFIYTRAILGEYGFLLSSGGPLSALTCCVNVRLLSAIKKISPLIYSQSWVGSWVYTMQAMMTFTLIF